jgi:hypothetical protein
MSSFLLRSILFPAAFLFAALRINAQANLAHDSIDINNINAMINAGGDNFNDHGQRAGFEVPKGSHKITISASSLWIAAYDDQQNLHVAAMTYRQNGSDFWSGPLDTTNATISSSNSASWDKIFKVTKAEIEAFKSGGTPSQNILSWPGNGNSANAEAHKMAPFVDVDHDGLYKPSAGDYPDIKGDMMLWSVFNDAAAVHKESGGLPLGLEVHSSVYGFNAPTDAALNNTIFIRYELINRSANNYTNVNAGIWTDFDLGYSFDDYLGSDSALNAYFTYNGKDTDAVYGTHIPVMSVSFLDSGMNSFLSYGNNFNVDGNPQKAADYYNFLNGKWTDGSCITLGGPGYGGSQCTRYMYPDDPYGSGGWSEISAGNKPDDIRGVGSIKPFSLAKGEHKVFTVAYTFSATANGSTKENLGQMKTDIAHIQELYNKDKYAGLPPVSEKQYDIGNSLQVYPNPASDHIFIRMNDPAVGSLHLYNELGQEVYFHTCAATDGTFQLDASAYAPGVYTLVMTNNNGVARKKIVISR